MRKAKRTRRSAAELERAIDEYLNGDGSRSPLSKDDFLDNLLYDCNECNGGRDLGKFSILEFLKPEQGKDFWSKNTLYFKSPAVMGSIRIPALAQRLRNSGLGETFNSAQDYKSL